jgi:hypothetical protein
MIQNSKIDTNITGNRTVNWGTTESPDTHTFQPLQRQLTTTDPISIDSLDNLTINNIDKSDPFNWVWTYPALSDAIKTWLTDRYNGKTSVKVALYLLNTDTGVWDVVVNFNTSALTAAGTWSGANPDALMYIGGVEGLGGMSSYPISELLNNGFNLSIDATVMTNYDFPETVGEKINLTDQLFGYWWKFKKDVIDNFRFQNNNISILPFYPSIEEQNHRKSYAYGDIYPLFTPSGFLPPFQIMRPTRSNAITSVIVKNVNGEVVYDITAQLIAAGLQITSFSLLYDYDVIVYPAMNAMVGIDMDEGIYYVEITDGIQVWYSDIFTVVKGGMEAYLKVEWSDIEDFILDSGRIVYQSPTFRNIVYLGCEIGKPEYKFEEEGEDRDGYFFPSKQLSEKTYRFTFLAPEYLCDVMRLIRMSDIVTITDRYGRVYNCDTFLMTPKWQTQGNLASVEVEFETNTVAKKTGKALIVADFNDDFNNDFQI